MGVTKTMQIDFSGIFGTIEREKENEAHFRTVIFMQMNYMRVVIYSLYFR